MLKIFIIFPFVDGPYGGGNQFLKALASVWKKAGILAATPEEATAYLFNSHHAPDRVRQLRQIYPHKKFIHRVDGPIRLITNDDDPRESLVYSLAQEADGFIFQSEFCRNANLKFGFPIGGKKYTTIINEPDEKVFYPKKEKKEIQEILKIIATSWSGNIKKGFEIYQWLDENLDFSRYEMTFIGNSPFSFGNIKTIPPCSSANLANYLRESDVYITASSNDPCSNALIEAIHCGLVPVAKNSGGHPEIIGDQRLLFTEAQEIPLILDAIACNRLKPDLSCRKSIEQCAELYKDFIVFCVKKDPKSTSIISRILKSIRREE